LLLHYLVTTIVLANCGQLPSVTILCSPSWWENRRSARPVTALSNSCYRRRTRASAQTQSATGACARRWYAARRLPASAACTYQPCLLCPCWARPALHAAQVL